jgi:purine-nucleoside phosphorylase
LIDDPAIDPLAVARQAAERLAGLTTAPRHDIAVVLGSGWAPAADLLGTTLAAVKTTELPGFAPPATAGQVDTIRSVQIGDGGRRALVLGTRTHLYEGRGVRAVAHGVRTAAAAGCRTIVLTNSCGSLDPSWHPGTPVLISDHINLTGTSPVEGAVFVELSDLYSARLRAVCRQVEPGLAEGVYVQFRGPQYETPAEVRMAGILGGNLVGMSTALEAIAAREAGLEVLGVSLVTNPAVGMSATPVDHAEVIAAGRAATRRVGDLLAEVVRRI